MEIVWRGRDKVCYDKVEIFIENGKIPIQSGFSRRNFGPSTLELTFWTDGRLDELISSLLIQQHG